MENEEIIRHNMEQTRESLTDKLETLEKKVMSSVEKATTAVNETVTSVKETMHEGVETVKDAVDVPAHVERHPWLMLGGSVLCGYVLGTLLSGGKKAPQNAAPAPLPPIKPSRVPGNGRHPVEAPQPVAAGPSWFSAIEPEIQHLKGLALGVTLGTVREILAEQVPPHVAEQLRTIVDGLTEKLGGEPIPSADFAASKCPSESAVATEGSGFDVEKPRW